ncbi:MAG: hypothetical protein GY832_12070 [Chloroflexi bacterium]|nr:hypothetical protein [Chloroflexota bacterium]
MSLFLVLVIGLPLLGAGGVLGLSLVPRVRSYSRYIALVAVGLTTILILLFRWIELGSVVRSLWQPSLLFGSVLTWEIDATMGPLSLVLALVTGCSLLVELSSGDAPRSSPIAALLALLSANLITLWSANILTMAVSWAIYDLLQTIAHIAVGGSTRTAIRGLVLGNVATLLLWTGSVLSGSGADSELWPLMTPSGAALTLWAMAGMLRLWAYPFHLAVPDDLDTASPFAAPLFLGPIVGWGLWLRLCTINGGFAPDDAWISTLAVCTLTLGSLLAWSSESPRRSLPWIGVSANGALLLVSGFAGEGAIAVIIIGSVGWVLGMTTFFLSDGWRRKALLWNIPIVIALLTLLGVPFTLGFVTASSLLGGLVQGGRVAWGMAFWGTFLGYLLLLPSLVRRMLVSPLSSLPEHFGMAVARGVGLGLPTLFLIVAGLYPPLLIDADVDHVLPSLSSLFVMPGLVGWLLCGVVLVCGCVIAWQERVLRSNLGLLLNIVHDLLRLGWFYDSLNGALDRGLTVFRVADELVGGAGALLWSLVLFLLLLLVWGGL